MNKLAKHQKQKNLVSIRRSEIDLNSIQGFVLGHSDELVAIQYVYDFNLDGLMVLRVADITDVKNSATNKFQKKLLDQEGLLAKVLFEKKLDLGNWKSAISQLLIENELMVIESEAGEEMNFFIGKVLKVTKLGVQARFFSGAADWTQHAEKIMFKDITCCQVSTNYIKVYERYFERQAQQ